MVCSTWFPPLINLDSGGIITEKIIGKKRRETYAASCFWAFFFKWHNGFLEDCIITLIDKRDGTDSTRREEYWRGVLNTVTSSDWKR